ncbi:MAG: DUF2400 domain-containing protein [Thermoplasmata archaeon]|nr:DUF2400 domain-containing protein [Thermoplasmata archaeon]MCI4356399.1 DUF2400 domain-containing protein [Thermoplasmata archaeon]
MAAVHRPSPELPEHLRTLYDSFPFARSVPEDPVSCVAPFRADPKATEVAGIFASTLAIGNTTAIRGSFAELLRRSGGDLVGGLLARAPRERVRLLAGFHHRWIRGDQMAHLAGRLATIYASGETLESSFADGWRSGGFAHGLDALAVALRGPENTKAPPGYRVLFPSPLDAPASPCKRLTLFVRWMVRNEPPDLGIWHTVPASDLRIPLDQHTFWIAYHVGLTSRRTRSWRTVEEVTAALRSVDAADPIRYDFVLCHTGISGDCPKERDMSVCGPCVLRPDCLLWRRRRTAG